ncbi:unnamed protein product, partial [Mesorhabditis belari]|uniref:EH domain-containing protein n=1 Tax=Mesorhabditis belari TaxID=2138241 RepID=A0AAF3E811_9BILA
MEEVMRSGNIPIAGKMGVVGGGGVVPPALLDESRVPKFYLDALTACGAVNSNMLPHTALVYNLMVTSGLPRPVLSYIWSAVNRSLPGQLTRSEFFSCLALIALAQRGESLVALSEMQQLPLPHLQTFTISSTVPPASNTSQSEASAPPVLAVVRPPPSSSNPIQRQQIPSNSSSAQTASPSKSRFIPSAFIPSSLLPRWSEKPSSSNTTSVKKTTEVLSGVFPSTDTASSSNRTASQQTSTNCEDPMEVSKSIVLDSSSHSTSETISTDATICLNKSDEKHMEGHGMHKIEKDDPRFLECWVKALSAATSIMEEANLLIGSDLDSGVLTEVANTKRGQSYYDSLEKDQRIIKRLLVSGRNSLPPEVRLRAEKALEVWIRLSNFHVKSENDLDLKELWTCGICAQGICSNEEVEYGGHKYHSDCANLWVNCVTPIFPITSQ